MDILTIVKQVALSLFARRKKWIILTSVLTLALFLPVAYLMSKEPPRYRTSTMIFLESRAPSSLFQEFSPGRPLSVQLAILQSGILAQSVVEALPRASVSDLIDNPYSQDYWLDFQNRVRRLRGLPLIVESPERRALAELRNARVSFNPLGPSGLVEIRAEASNPRVALDIANTYVEIMLARTRSFNVDDAKGTREYLAQQNAQVSEQLHSSEKSFQEFALVKGGMRLPDRVAEVSTRLSQLETTPCRPRPRPPPRPLLPWRRSGCARGCPPSRPSCRIHGRGSPTSTRACDCSASRSPKCNGSWETR